MRPTVKLAAALSPALALTLAVALVATRAASAPEPPAGASAAPSASAAASAPPGRAAPSIADWIPPEEASEKPKPEAWEQAAPLSLLRPHASCTASALREWIRISCRSRMTEGGGMDGLMGVRVLAGSDEGVHIIDFKAEGEKGKAIDAAHVIFPVRRGDRRLLGFDGWKNGGWKMFYITEDTEVAISETWLPGERGPTIVVD
jgi:hypothetical protein